MRKKIAKHPFLASVTVLLTILISVIAIFSFQSQQNKLDAQDPLDEGETRMTKTAKAVDGEVNKWDIELTVEAQNYYPPLPNDIVIVIDVSGSMEDEVGGKTRLEKAQEAAVDFVNQILQTGYENRVALVTFSTDATVAKQFTEPTDKQDLINTINALRPGGGTYTQLGLHVAGEYLEGNYREFDSEDREVSRSIILLSDGMATYSARPLPSDGDWAYPYLNGTQYMNSLGTSFVPGYYNYETQDGMTQFDYSTSGRRGDGNTPRELVDSNVLTGDNLPTLSIANIPPSEVVGGLNPATTRRYYNNGNAAIAESKLVQQLKYGDGRTVVDEIYTIGLDFDAISNTDHRAEARKTMEGIATNGNDFIIDIDSLDTILQNIGAALMYLINDGELTDPIATGFVLEGNVSNITVSHGTVSLSTDGQGRTVINWDVGNSVAGFPTDGYFKATMNYTISLTDEILGAGIIGADGLAETNGDTFIEYTTEGQPVKEDFVVPKVKPIIVTLEKRLMDETGSQIIDNTQNFDVELTGAGIASKLDYALKSDGNKVSIVRNWQADTDYTITEVLGTTQEYGTHIMVRTTDTPGVQATFNFGDDPANFENMDIIVYNDPLPDEIVRLHVRQVLVTTNGEIVQPNEGYYNSQTTVGSIGYSFNSNSSTINTPALINQSLFKSYGLLLEDTDNILNVRGIVPEHYSLVGYVVTDDVADLTTHVSTNPGLQTATNVNLDYSAADEYWVTVFIQADPDSPGMNNWDYELNEFGKVLKP